MSVPPVQPQPRLPPFFLRLRGQLHDGQTLVDNLLNGDPSVDYTLNDLDWVDFQGTTHDRFPCNGARGSQYLEDARQTLTTRVTPAQRYDGFLRGIGPDRRHDNTPPRLPYGSVEDGGWPFTGAPPPQYLTTFSAYTRCSGGLSGH